MTRRDPIAAVTSAEAELNRLLERREQALEGGHGPVPDPAVIEAAERALQAARAKLRKVFA